VLSTKRERVRASSFPTPRSSAVTRLGLSAPLRYAHLGERLTFPGDARDHVLDMRAEVAVLNRSVRVSGDASSLDTMYGAHIMVSSPASLPRKAAARLEQVEVSLAGQAFRWATCASACFCAFVGVSGFCMWRWRGEAGCGAEHGFAAAHRPRTPAPAPAALVFPPSPRRLGRCEEPGLVALIWVAADRVGVPALYRDTVAC
jgi:hypothetical protein